MQSNKLVLSMLLTAIVMAGCTTVEKPVPTPCQVALQQVKDAGILVIQSGDQVKMILPTDDFFAPKSTALQRSSFPVLHNVKNLLQCYKKVDVSIIGYTDSCGDATVNQAIALAQSKLIANELWQYGIDGRFLTAKGVAVDQPSASNRIEITFTQVTEPLL